MSYIYKIFYFYMFLTILFLYNYIILKFEYYLLECQCWTSNLRIIMVQSRQDFSKKFKFHLAKESNTNSRFCFLFPSSFIITILCIGKISEIKKFFIQLIFYTDIIFITNNQDFVTIIFFVKFA